MGHMAMTLQVPYHYINHDFFKVKSIDSNLDWLVTNYFCEFINNNKD